MSDLPSTPGAEPPADRLPFAPASVAILLDVDRMVVPTRPEGHDDLPFVRETLVEDAIRSAGPEVYERFQGDPEGFIQAQLRLLGDRPDGPRSPAEHALARRIQVLRPDLFQRLPIDLQNLDDRTVSIGSAAPGCVGRIRSTLGAVGRLLRRWARRSPLPVVLAQMPTQAQPPTSLCVDSFKDPEGVFRLQVLVAVDGVSWDDVNRAGNPNNWSDLAPSFYWPDTAYTVTSESEAADGGSDAGCLLEVIDLDGNGGSTIIHLEAARNWFEEKLLSVVFARDVNGSVCHEADPGNVVKRDDGIFILDELTSGGWQAIVIKNLDFADDTPDRDAWAHRVCNLGWAELLEAMVRGSID